MRESLAQWLRVTLPLLVLVLTSFALQAQGKQGKREKPQKAETWAVVQVGEQAQVVTSSSAKGMKKRVASEYKRALKQWETDKKAAKKNKQPFEEPRPEKQKVKVLSSRLKSREEADKWLQQWEAKQRKKSSPKRGADDKPAKDKPGKDKPAKDKPGKGKKK